MRKIANIKYIETTDIFSSTDAFFWKIKPKKSSVEVTVGGGLILVVQAPDIYKEEARREDSSHTEHLREMTRRGQHSTPKNTTSWEDRKREKMREEREITTLQYLGWSLGHGARRGHAGPFSTTDASAGQQPGG